jgi:hypothetical protein
MATQSRRLQPSARRCEILLGSLARQKQNTKPIL